MQPIIDANRVRQLFLIALILLIGVVLFQELAFYIPALLGALTLYILFRSTFFNQDGNEIELYYILCMVEDKEGAIWLGSNKGPLVIYNPQRIFESNFYLYKT